MTCTHIDLTDKLTARWVRGDYVSVDVHLSIGHHLVNCASCGYAHWIDYYGYGFCDNPACRANPRADIAAIEREEIAYAAKKAAEKARADMRASLKRGGFTVNPCL